MSAASPAPSPTEDSDGFAAWERALLDRQLEALGRLADMGMAIAGAIERRATEADAAEAPAPALHHAAMDFARVSRAVRLSFALQSSLVAEFKGVGRRRNARADNDDDDIHRGPLEVVWLDSEHAPEAVKRRVQDAVRERAEAEGLDRETVERLVLDAGERLDREALHDGLFVRPFDKLVALICKDLGLEPPVEAAWSARAPPRAGELSRSD